LGESTSYAKIRPTLSIRRLTIEADAIVIAEPLDTQPNVMPQKYRVLEVLQGASFAVDGEVKLSKEGLPKLALDERTSRFFSRENATPPEIDKALLFIQPPFEGLPARNGEVYAQVRALAKSGEALVPQQPEFSDDPLYLLPRKDVTWDGMLAKVRADLPAVNHVRELRAIADPAQRNEALLDWIRAHRSEFGGGHFEGSSKGWATYEYKLFEWIYESCRPEDSWAALTLDFELNGRPWFDFPSFCSTEGRSLVLS